MSAYYNSSGTLKQVHALLANSLWPWMAGSTTGSSENTQGSGQAGDNTQGEQNQGSGDNGQSGSGTEDEGDSY